MPDNHTHSEHTYRLFGERASDLHLWMDEPWKNYGRSHRQLRHDTFDPPEWAVEKYGLELTRKIMRDHLELDILEYEQKFGNLNDYSLLGSNEKVRHVLRSYNIEFIITDNQLIIMQDTNMIRSYFWDDIYRVELADSRQLFGILGFITKKKLLKIYSTYSSPYDQYTVHEDDLDINQLKNMLPRTRKSTRD